MLKIHRYKHKLLIPISCFSIIAATAGTGDASLISGDALL